MPTRLVTKAPVTQNPTTHKPPERSTMARTLPELRVLIDAVDQDLLKLLNQRAACALEIGEIKRAFNRLAIGTCKTACTKFDATVVAHNNCNNLGKLFVL